MAVKIRLIRMGKTKQPTYRVVVMDSRTPRDGRYLDRVGRYDPRQEPSLVEIDNEKAVAWMQKGAQPTDTVKKLFEISGAMSRLKVAKGHIHTVPLSPPLAVSAPVETKPEEATEPVAAEDPLEVDTEPAPETPEGED